MTAITVIPKQPSVEALQYDGTPQSAYDIMAALRASAQATQNYTLNLSYNENSGQPAELYFTLNNDAYNVRSGDWLIIEDGDLFSVCRQADFTYRYNLPVAPGGQS